MKTINPHEIYCLANADHFVAARGRTPATRTRETFPTMDQAKEYAAGFGDKKTMVYAITAQGNSAHICNA